MLSGYKTHNDLIFSIMMPVTRKDIIKSTVAVIVILELLHMVIAVIYGIISSHLYPNVQYIFFKPTIGFWRLNFVMLAIFNIIFISMYYKTAYKYGAATIVSILGAMLFAGGAEYLGIKNSFVYGLMKGAYAENLIIQLTILVIGVAVFILFNFIAYTVAIKRFEKVDI